jgi:peptidyl-prolyl cis-trans isomerase C
MPPFMKEQLNNPEGRKRLLNAIVEEEIIVREARARGLDDLEEFTTEMARRERDALVRLFYERVIEQASTPSQEQVARYYETNKGEFRTPETIEARHILVETMSQAQDVRRQIEAGADFAETARLRSLDIFTKEQGGLIPGGVRQGEPLRGIGDLPEVVEACFQMDEGDLSEPVKTAKGYHIILVEKRTPETFRSLDEVRNDIVSRLTYENRDAVRDSIMDDLKARYNVSFMEETSLPEQTPEELFKIASEEPLPKKKIEHYKRFVEKFPNDDRAYEARFMIGFTMAEDLRDYDGAEKVFREFLEEYPETDLSDDAQWMIDNMRSGREPEFDSE